MRATGCARQTRQEGRTDRAAAAPAAPVAPSPARCASAMPCRRRSPTGACWNPWSRTSRWWPEGCCWRSPPSRSSGRAGCHGRSRWCLPGWRSRCCIAGSRCIRGTTDDDSDGGAITAGTGSRAGPAHVTDASIPRHNAAVDITAGTLTALYLFDVAEQIDLPGVRGALGAGNQARLTLKSAAPAYLQYHVPPLVVDGDVAGIASMAGFSARLKFFDY